MKYVKGVWRNTSSGCTFANGLFITRKEAEESYMLYNNFINGTIPEITKCDTVFWINLKPIKSGRKIHFDYSIDYKIITGTKYDFYNELKSGKCNFGPFKDKAYLEDIKPKVRECTAFD